MVVNFWIIDVQDNSDDGNDDGGIEEDGRHVYAFQSLASKYQVESDDNDESVDLNALLKHNKPYVDNEELDLELGNIILFSSVCFILCK